MFCICVGIMYVTSLQVNLSLLIWFVSSPCFQRGIRGSFSLVSNMYSKYGFARQRGNHCSKSIGSNVPILRHWKALVFGKRASISSFAELAIFDGPDRFIPISFRLCF